MKKVLLIGALICSFGMIFTLIFVGIGFKNKKKQVARSHSKVEKVDISKTLDQYQGAYDATNDLELLQTVKKVAGQMVENEFIYSTSGVGKSLEDAIDGNHHGDCAHLVCWSLQDMGILTEKQTFYSKKDGSLSCKKDSKVYKALEKKATIIKIDPIKGSDQEALKKVLKAGDICCYKLHMNVVAGVNKKGNVIYYDGGLTPVEKHKRDKRYLEDLEKPYGRPNMKNTLYTIIRLKD